MLRFPNMRDASTKPALITLHQSLHLRMMTDCRHPKIVLTEIERAGIAMYWSLARCELDSPQSQRQLCAITPARVRQSPAARAAASPGACACCRCRW